MSNLVQKKTKHKKVETWKHRNMEYQMFRLKKHRTCNQKIHKRGIFKLEQNFKT